MNLPFFPKLSLRARFLIAMGIVFFPVVVVAIGASLFLQHSANALNRIVEQPIYKLQATSRLQNQIRKTSALARDYAITPRFALRSQFDVEAAGVDAIFSEILGKPFLDPKEYSLLASARREWKDSLTLAGVIFTSRAPKAALNQLDQRVYQIMFQLDQAYDAYYTEIGTQRAQINESEKRYLLVILVLVGLGLLIAIIGAVWLIRSVLVPLREFEKGMAKFSQNNLSYRLPLETHDEIGHLAREFNAMAERLMQHQHKLEELSARDSLTGLYNRRELEKRLHEEAQRARRYQHPLSVLMLDIDHFKNVNDQYGHQAGDEVLITVTDLIQLHMRPVDVVCRYGGEELAVILPETDEEGARTVAERVRATVADSITTTPQGDMVHVTVSIGIATFPRDGDTASGLIHAADTALYVAKQEGRNLVRSH
ncbi:MAG: diguanylate cyclase [Gammaproteobacteria bacterium]|nr:diguanylate cyclase [Gammaproteobacteria bacterium]